MTTGEPPSAESSTRPFPLGMAGAARLAAVTVLISVFATVPLLGNAASLVLSRVALSLPLESVSAATRTSTGLLRWAAFLDDSSRVSQRHDAVERLQRLVSQASEGDSDPDAGAASRAQASEGSGVAVEIDLCSLPDVPTALVDACDSGTAYVGWNTRTMQLLGAIKRVERGQRASTLWCREDAYRTRGRMAPPDLYPDVTCHNLAPDPGFEAPFARVGLPGHSAPIGYYDLYCSSDGRCGEGIMVAGEAGPAELDNSALLLDAKSRERVGVAADIGVSAQRAYLLVGSLRTIGADLHAYMGGVWLDDEGRALQYEYLVYGDQSHQWRTVMGVLEPPPEATRFRVLLLNLSERGVVLYDDVALFDLPVGRS